MSFKRRANFLILIFIIANLLILFRLFYWQVLASSGSRQLAWRQYRSLIEKPAFRGEILATDGFPLATSQKAYLLYASLPELKQDSEEVAEKLAPIFLESLKKDILATGPAVLDDELLVEEIEDDFKDKFSNDDLVWIALKHKLSYEEKEAVEALKIDGLGFEEEESRFYPEASMSAQLLGFVGQDESGQDRGYFGLEGFYDLELKGQPGQVSLEKDAANNPILIGSIVNQEEKDGKDLILHIDRAVQYIVEEKLKEAVDKYKAKSGFVVVLDPFTGGIIAMAATPSYDPKTYYNFDKDLFKNPIVGDTYEPGSTFKIFVMAAGLDSEVVKKDSKCDICHQPYKIDKYELKTWDEEYHPDSNMTEVIQNSDNLGMVYVSQKLELDRFWEYLKAFGFIEKTNIDLQEEVSSSIKPKKKWSYVDLATASFGQGIAVTGIQMVQAAAAIANGGKLMESHIVDKVISGNKTIEIKPKIIRQVLKEETAAIITKMMVNAVNEGEASWCRLKDYKIAGKTGTAQIPIAGHYDKEKTIVSFVGFAPADKPRFVMLVSLREPQSSPWGSETAAPLFFKIAKEILTYYGIQPD